MTKELFIETIEQIKQQSDHDNEVADHLGRAFHNAFPANLLPDNDYLKNQLIKILQIEFDDHHKHSWIEYFIYELDFGRKYREGCVRHNGHPVALETSQQLYDFLTKLKAQ